MVKAYFETNIINWIRRAGWSNDDLKGKLDKFQISPYFGMHGIYELARGLQSPSSREDAQHNFQILLQLDPSYCPTVQMLRDMELDHLRTGATVIPVLSYLNQISAKYQVSLMARGTLEKDGRLLLDKRERAIDKQYPAFTDYQLRVVAEARKSKGVDISKLRTFEDVFVYLDSEIPRLIYQLLGNRVTMMEAKELHARLNSFPTIRTTLRANLYMWAIPFLHEMAPSRDKLDDYRHIIEASYSDVFITGDNQLARTVPRINPDIRVISWTEFFRQLEKSCLGLVLQRFE